MKARQLTALSSALLTIMLMMSACGNNGDTENVTTPAPEETDHIEDIITITEEVSDETNPATATENAALTASEVTAAFTEQTAPPEDVTADISADTLPETTETVTEAEEIADTSSDEWGIEMSVKDVTPTGCTVIFAQSGGNAAGELESGTYYTLEHYENGEWDTVEMIVNEFEYPWAALSLPIIKNDTAEYGDNWHNWETRYGELPAGQYRIGKEIIMSADYSDTPQRKMYWAEFEIEAASDEWGIEMTVKDVTPTGCTVVFTQSGGAPTGELITGSYYIIEQYANGEWTETEWLPQEYEVAWTEEARIINKDDSTEYIHNWQWLYGELSPGKYRIGKEVAGFRENGDNDRKMYRAEFEI